LSRIGRWRDDWGQGLWTRTSEETITGLVNIPEGIVVLREVKEQGRYTGQPVGHEGDNPERQLREVALPRIAPIQVILSFGTASRTWSTAVVYT
jgi:hypothetical protein